MNISELTPTLDAIKRELQQREFSTYSVLGKIDRDTVTAINCTLDTRRLRGQAQAAERIESVRAIIGRYVQGGTIAIHVNATGHPLGT